jgi:hypothetical protein
MYLDMIGITDNNRMIRVRDIPDLYEDISTRNSFTVTVITMDSVMIHHFSRAPIPAILMRGPVSIRVVDSVDVKRLTWRRVNMLFNALPDHFADVRVIVFNGYRVINDLEEDVWSKCTATDGVVFSDCVLDGNVAPLVFEGLARARRITRIVFKKCRLNLSLLRTLDHIFLGNIRKIVIEGNYNTFDPLYQALDGYFNGPDFVNLFRRITNDRFILLLSGYGNFPSYVNAFFDMVNDEPYRELYAFFFRVQDRLFNLLTTTGGFNAERFQFELIFYKRLNLDNISQRKYDRIFVINQLYDFLRSRNLLGNGQRDIYYPVVPKNTHVKTMLLALLLNNDPNVNLDVKRVIQDDVNSFYP